MGRLALHTDPSLSHSWDPEMPFTAHYRCLWASFDRETDIGDSYETQGRHRSAVYLTGQVKGWIFLYERLPEPSRDRVKYDKEDIRAFAESFADWTLHDTLKVRDVICQKSFVAGMANLEEGVAKNKSWGGRIVLVGDACHKFTPNAGLGFNNGVQDVVSLCNRLNALNSTNSTDSLLKPSFTVPDAVSLQQAFEEYEAERAEPLKGDYRGAADATRLSAWENWRYYALAKYILRFGFVRNYLITHKASPGIRDGLVLDYITADEPFTGSILWEHPLGNP